jgi:hypothetical protein
MAEIMTQPCNTHVVDVLLADLELSMLLLIKLLHLLAREVAGADAVLEAVVHGSGEDVVHAAQLLEVAKALELFSINDVPASERELKQV